MNSAKLPTLAGALTVGVPALPARLWDAKNAWAAMAGWFTPIPTTAATDEREQMLDTILQRDLFKQEQSGAANTPSTPG